MADSTQFNLGRQLAVWRQRLTTLEQLRPQDVDELESHLRESMADLHGKGLSEEEAFLIAERRLGDGRTLGEEYGKVHRTRVWLGRIGWMLTGILAFRIGLGLATSAGWLAVAGMEAWLPQTTWLGVLGIGVRIASLTVLLVGFGFLLWCIDRGAMTRLQRHPLWLGLGLGFLSLVALAAPHMGTILLARTTPVESLGRIMMTSSIGSMVCSALAAFALGLGLAWVLWVSNRDRSPA